MERGEIRQKFEAAIDEAVAGAKAKLDAATKDKLSNMAGAAAFHIAMRIDDEEEERRAIDAGIAAYRKLIAKLVSAARTLTMFPELNEHGLGLALQQLGPEPPFYMA